MQAYTLLYKPLAHLVSFTDFERQWNSVRDINGENNCVLQDQTACDKPILLIYSKNNDCEDGCNNFQGSDTQCLSGRARNHIN